MSRQLSHHTTEFEKKKFPLVLILDGISGPANIGSIFRLADAFHIEKVVLCGVTIDMASHRLKKTARATVEKIAFEVKESCIEVCAKHMEMGYSLLALEITSTSISIDTENFSNYKKIALVVGNENSGVDEEVLSRTKKNLHITMFGNNSSMNVAQATGIALYEITKSLPHI